MKLEIVSHTRGGNGRGKFDGGGNGLKEGYGIYVIFTKKRNEELEEDNDEEEIEDEFLLVKLNQIMTFINLPLKSGHL